MKHWIGVCVRGALMGAGLQQLLAIAISVRLRLGYYMACLATLPEIAGGEIQGVVLQTGISVLTGVCVALAAELWRQRQWRLRRRMLASGAATLAGLFPAALLCLRASQGLL